MSFGWTGTILNVDLTTQKSVVEDVAPYSESFIGGRGINVKIVYDRIGREISPFDAENLICIGAGVLAGSPAPCSSRSTITAMSPRGLLDSSGIGGFVGAELKFAGYDHVIVRGKAEWPVYLYITNDTVEIKDAKHLWGKDPWQTQCLIRDELGDQDIQSLAIGLAGENLVHYACVITGRLQSAAGRCGMGAIMGSKNLKAIAVRGRGVVRLAEPERFLEACLKMHTLIRENETYKNRRACVTDKSYYEMYLKGGKLVTGNWEDADWGQTGFDGLLEDPEGFWQKSALHHQPKLGQQPGCFGCPMYHETYFKIPPHNDVSRTKCLQWLLAGALWLKDRREAIEAAYLCDRYGLDTISTGNCIAFLMELYHRGVISAADTDGIAMERGSMTAIREMITKIAGQEGIGAHFKQGVAAGARHFGRQAEKYAIHIKGMAPAPIEFRIFKSIALLASIGKAEQLSVIEYYGASNTAAMQKLARETLGKEDYANPTTYEDKALLAVDSENRHCMGDLLGMCKTLIPWGPMYTFETCARLLSLATGKAYSLEELELAAKRTILLERAFNVIRGIRRKDEHPPRRLFENAVTDGQFKGEMLDAEQFEGMLTDYYSLRGCDEEGIPTYQTFADVDLRSEWELFAGQMNPNVGVNAGQVA